MSEERKSRLEALAAAAEPADNDTEEMLLHLQRMQEARRADPDLEARYEDLRDRLVAHLRTTGPRYFIGSSGAKEYAYVVAQETVEADLKILSEMHEKGEITDEVWDEIAPRQISAEGLRQAIARGSNPRRRKPGLSPAQVTKAIRFRPRTPWVGFMDHEDTPGAPE